MPATDPRRLYRKGSKVSELRYRCTRSDNRHGLIANARVTQGKAAQRADRGYDAAEFVEALQEMKVVPHMAQNTAHRRSAMPVEIASKRWLCPLPAQAQAQAASHERRCLMETS